MIKFDSYNLLSEKNTLLNLNINTINFKDVISLFFYAVENISSPNNNINNPEQKKLFIEYFKIFENNIKYQNSVGLPKLSYITNDKKKRLEIFSPSLYHPTQNILVLLLRLLHIEEFKEKQNIQGKYEKVLSHKINIIDSYNCADVSIIRLFEILKDYMNYYIKIYDNGMMYENKLGVIVLSQM